MSKKYDDTVKKNVVNDYEKGMLVKEIVERYRIPRSTICEWIYSNKERVDIHNQKYSKSKIKALEEVNDALSKELKIYLKVIEYVQIDDSIRLKVAEVLYKDGFNMANVCSLIGLEKSKFYRYLKNKNKLTWFEKDTLELTPLIIKIFETSKARFGPQKIKIKLHEIGYDVSQKKIAKIMKDNQLIINQVKSKLTYPKKNKDLYLHNALKQQFIQNEPNKVWVSDVTFIKIDKITCYLCVIMDLFSRKVVGYMVSTTNTDSLTTRTFSKAFFERGEPGGLMFHSDRGSNYTSKKMKRLLKMCGVKQSCSNTGNPYDNAVIESFFATFKKELVNLKAYDTVFQLKADVDEYMDYYNNYRPHRTLQNKTPSKFEEKYYEELGEQSNVQLIPILNY